MTDPIIPATPVAVAGKSNITTMHGIIAVAAFVVVAVACKYFGIDTGIAAMLSTFVGVLLVALGVINATDSATTQATASIFSAVINQGVDEAKAYALELHNKNATAIAVNSAQIAVVIPQPIAVTVPIVPSPATVTTQSAHLVND